MLNDRDAVWLATGLRTPFVGVDGAFANRDSLALSVPVVQAMAPQVNGSIDFAVWGSVVLDLAYANLAREVRDADLVAGVGIEPLDIKMDILRRIPRLRKVSMSPWINLERAVKAVGQDSVFSFKPSPASIGPTGADFEQNGSFNLFNDFKCRVEFGFGRMSAKDGDTERMNRADACRIKSITMFAPAPAIRNTLPAT